MQYQIQNREVQFSHDDSGLPPSYIVQVGNGLETLTQPASIVFIHQGARLINNQLMINQGQTVTIFSTQFSAEDLDNINDDPNLIFHSQCGSARIFSTIWQSGSGVNHFFQSQIEVGSMQFVHDGSKNAPSFSIAVSDSYISTTPQAGNVSFNLSPILGSNAMSINQGQTMVLTSAMFSATDPDDPAPGLIFMVSNVQHGQFELVSSPGDAITRFIQSQIQNGTVQFVQDGTVYVPSDQVAVSDSKMTIVPQATKISFNAAPVLIKNQLTINQGQTIVVTGSDLSTTDPDNSASSLMFIVNNVLHGQFELVSSPGSAITHFTQAEVQNDAIQFAQDGGAIAPSYRVAVSDGKMTISSQPSMITFDASPELINNYLVAIKV